VLCRVSVWVCCCVQGFAEPSLRRVQFCPAVPLTHLPAYAMLCEGFCLLVCMVDYVWVCFRVWYLCLCSVCECVWVLVECVSVCLCLLVCVSVRIIL
jgi:hypothetical protein